MSLPETDRTEYHALYRPVVGDDVDIWGMFLNANIDRYEHLLPRFGPLSERPPANELPTGDETYWYMATDTSPISIHFYDGGTWRTVWDGDAETLSGSTPGDFLATTGGTITGDLDVAGALTADGAPVWHTANFDPTDKLETSGGTITGDLGITGGLDVDGQVAADSVHVGGVLSFDALASDPSSPPNNSIWFVE